MSNLKAVITLNQYGNYEIRVERHRLNCVPQVVSDRLEVTWTLKGARRLARKMLAKAEVADENAKFREVIE